jgi:hypothetical protein
MQECIFDIQLVNRSCRGNNNAQNGAYSGRFHDGTECFTIVDSGTLRISAYHPAGLMSSKRPIGVKFVFENPLASDHICSYWTGNKSPSAIVNECMEFLLKVHLVP